GVPEPAPHVGDPATGPQLLDHAGERGQPLVHQVRGVAGAEEAGGAREEVGVVLVPAHPAAVVEGALQPLPLVRRTAGEERLEPAEDEGGAALVGEGGDLLRRGAEASVALVRQVSAGG